MKLDEMDSFIILTALEQNDFNVSQTADILGTTRETLRYRIQKYNIKDKAS
jgi:DNA-binding NtrC family response regulator